MPKFELLKIDLDCKWYPFFKLVRNGKCEFDEFESSLESKHQSDIARIYTIMEQVGCKVNLPKTMFRTLKNKHPTAFELKAGSLRVYGMHLDKTGKIIIFGGIKDSQNQDIDSLPKKIKEFLNYIKDQKNGKKNPNPK